MIRALRIVSLDLEWGDIAIYEPAVGQPYLR